MAVEPHTHQRTMPYQLKEVIDWMRDHRTSGNPHNLPWFDITKHGASTAASGAANVAAINKAAAAANAAGGGVVFVPAGTFACEGAVTIPFGNHITLRGVGLSSRLQWSVDSGAGTYAIQWGPFASWVNNIYMRVEDLWIVGPGGTGSSTRGVIASNMSGVRLERKCTMVNCRVDGFYGGIVIYGNHQRVLHSTARNNYFNVHFATVPTGDPMIGSNYGDQCFINSDFQGPVFACVAVGNSNGIITNLWSRIQLGYAPYSFYREAGVTAGTFIGFSRFEALGGEQHGNGVMFCEDMHPTFDAISDSQFAVAGFVSTVDYGGSSAVFNPTYKIAARAADYATRIGALRRSSFMQSTGLFGYPGDIGGLYAKTIDGCTFDGADAMLDEIDRTGKRPFIPFNASSMFFFQTNKIHARGNTYRLATVPATVTANKLVCNDSAAENRVVASTTAQPVGVTYQPITSGGLERGLICVDGKATVAATGAVAAGANLKRDTATAGNVVAAASATDLPFAGYALAADSLGTVSARIRGLD